MTSEAGYPPEGDEIRSSGQPRFTVPEVPEAMTPFSAFGAPSRPAEMDDLPPQRPEPEPGYAAPDAPLPQRTALTSDQLPPSVPPAYAPPPIPPAPEPAHAAPQMPPAPELDLASHFPPAPEVPAASAQARAAVRVPGAVTPPGTPAAGAPPTPSAGAGVYGSGASQPRVYGRPVTDDDAPASAEPAAPPAPTVVASARVSVPQASAPPRRAAEPVNPIAAVPAPPVSGAPASGVPVSGSPAYGSAQPVGGIAPDAPNGRPVSPASPSSLDAGRPMAAWQEQLQPSASTPPSGPGSPTPASQFTDEPAHPGSSTLRKLGYISIALLVVLLGIGALYYTSKPNPPSYKVGTCVREDGGKAAAVACSDPSAYQIVTKVTNHDLCADPTQPYATLPSGTVLCLHKKS